MDSGGVDGCPPRDLGRNSAGAVLKVQESSGAVKKR